MRLRCERLVGGPPERVDDYAFFLGKGLPSPPRSEEVIRTSGGCDPYWKGV